MIRALFRLLFAISLMTMPFGMASAAAGAAVHTDVTAIAGATVAMYTLGLLAERRANGS